MSEKNFETSLEIVKITLQSPLIRMLIPIRSFYCSLIIVKCQNFLKLLKFSTFSSRVDFFLFVGKLFPVSKSIIKLPII